MKNSKRHIVILHGWGASGKSFTELGQLLEKEGFRPSIPDLPGFGDRPLTKSPMTFDDYVDFVDTFIGNKKAILIGHSFGGRILAKYTADNPTKVEKLILVDASGITRPIPWKKKLGYVLAKIGKNIFRVPILLFGYPFVRKFLYAAIDEWDYYKAEGGLLETFKNVYKKDISVYLPNIHVPTLIVWGEKDITTPLNDAYVFHKRIKGSQLIVIKGATHKLPYQMPHVFVEKILPFIKS